MTTTKACQGTGVSGLSVCRWDGSVCRWDGSVCRMGWIGGILFYDYNQGLSGYRSKWQERVRVWARNGVRVVNGLPPNPNPTFSRVSVWVRIKVTLTLNLK